MASRAQVKVLSDNQLIVNDIADSIDSVPPSIDAEYVKKLERVAAYLGNPTEASQQESSSVSRASRQPVDFEVVAGSVNAPIFSSSGNDVAADSPFRNRTMAARNAVVQVISQVNSFIARAKNAGFAPPSNPFVKIAELNSVRGDNSVDVNDTDADDIVANIGVYLDFLKAENEGVLNLNAVENSAAQLSSVSLSFEGFGGSGNTAADMLRFLPDLDAVKLQKAKEAFSSLDFKKRIPKVIFTSTYSPTGDLKASLVGWKKIPDASGYVIRRRNLFTQEELSFSYSNDELQALYDGLRGYVQTWVMSFYDSIDPETIFVCLDGNIERDMFYSYTVQAYQLFNAVDGTIFSVDVGPLNLSQADRADLQSQLQKLNPDDSKIISPWPVISQQLLGRPDYDWILAGVNVRSSITRRDSRTNTRDFSYLTAKLDFIFQQMDLGNFVVPQDVNQVVKSTQQAINKFGVTQVIQEVLQETGILYFFEGKDPVDDTHFSRAGTVTPETSNLIAVIAASIDPETATMDLRTLASNLPSLLSGGGLLGTETQLSPGINPQVESSPAEISIPVSTDASNTEIQFIQKLGNIDDLHIDLTTFDGISKLARTIRIISDFGANRGALIA